jgi:SAM-dependent methyltransferase
MPTITENLFWGTYDWLDGGDEWSSDWGNAVTQWHSTILPRIRQFFPARRVLEIAPGHGRWSQFLIAGASDYIGVDLNPQCIEACQRRFAQTKNARFVANDGKSLDAVDDHSIDFVFSYDSLVHVEIDVLAAYITEMARKLAPDGIAFLHHSNLGEYDGAALKLCKSLSSIPQPWPIAHILHRAQLASWDCWRGASVTADKAASAAADVGLACISQEIITWGQSRRLIDCMTTLTRRGSKWERPRRVIRNNQFMKEAASAKILSAL